MKKYLLLLIILFIPFFVYAEEEEKTVSFIETFNFPFIEKYFYNGYTYLYADDYTYQDGVYTLVNPVSRNLSYPYTNKHFYYTCRSATESSCAELYVAYSDSDLLNYMRNSFPGFILKNGHTVDDYFYMKVSDSYKKEGNQYVLNNPEDVNTLITTRFRESYSLGGKYFCEDLSDSCEDLFFMFSHLEDYIYMFRISDDFVYGNGFDYQDGKYILKGIVPSKWPNFKEYIGTYSCMSHDTSCDTLYKITSYEPAHIATNGSFAEIFSPDEMTGVAVSSSVDNISMMKSDKYSVQTYIQDAEEIWIEDESILKIENGEIVPLKKGTTTVLFRKDQEVYLLHVDIQDVDQPDVDNPMTSANVILMITIFSLIVFGFIFEFKKWKDKHEKIVEE